MNENHCTMCGQNLDEWDINQDFSLNTYIGYGSKYDTETLNARFCCKCFDKIIDYISKNCVLSPFKD